jgi:hypothetical protein
VENSFKIHGIMLVKNEADIIEYAISEGLEWCDFIYVFDNGSSDGTWEIVKELSHTTPQVIPFQQKAIPFRDSLRGDVFRAFADQAETGDWWCRLDADEFYIDNPKEFLRDVPRREHVVWSIHYQYYFTEVDEKRFLVNALSEPCPKISDANRPRCFEINASEPRFFRHRSKLLWEGDNSWPIHMGVVHKRRIRLRHLQYRSPQQIEQRLKVRKQATAEGYLHFGHSAEASWRAKVTDSSDLVEEKNEQSLNVDYDPNSLPLHLETIPRRLMKRLLHGLRIWP